MLETKLLPCPFCGVIPHFKVKENICNSQRKAVSYAVYCQGCGLEFPQKFGFEIEFDLESTGGIRVVKDERSKAIEAWNRRANTKDEAWNVKET
ncbi:MAG: Lar family restriction alleviation protein [Ruminococcus sp.]|nr:Lar family restriction alleviation protein [Ruminococcus sp.]